MSSFNKVILMGNLTRDPVLSFTPSQTAVVDFGLATNRKWNAQDGSQRDETCFVDCRAFGRMAENINKFFKKGRPIFVEGVLSFDQWTGQDGVKHTKHRVTVQSFTFLPSGKDQAAGQVPDDSDPPAGENYPKSEPQAGTGNPDEIPY